MVARRFASVVLVGIASLGALADEDSTTPSPTWVESAALNETTLAERASSAFNGTMTPTMSPTSCVDSACLINGEEDAACCGLAKEGASCSSGFVYSRLDECAFSSQTMTQFYTTCCLPKSDSGSDDDGLTRAEELAVILTFTIVSAVLLLCFIRGTYYFVVGGCKYPDLGAVGSSVYYDERRGQCFGLVAFFTLVSIVTLVGTWLAAGKDPEMLEIFALARVQTSDTKTFLVIGLNGYAVFAAETSKSSGEYFSFDSNYGKDSDVGDRDDFDWTGGCDTGGTQAQEILIVMALTKMFCFVIIYRRQNPNTDTAVVKLLGVGCEALCGWLTCAVLLSWGLRCFAELPTGSIFLPNPDANYAYYDDANLGDDYKISFDAPYTSYLLLILNGIFSFYIAWVHWRTPTWGAELVEKNYY